MTPPSLDGPTSITSKTHSRMPEDIRPMIASHAPEPFDSTEYIFELMYGGIRAMAHIADGHVRLRGRNGRDLVSCFPELRVLPEMLGAREAVLDGEIVVLDGNGQPAFEAARPRLHALSGALDADAPPPELAKPRRLIGQLSYQAFDLLWLDGRSLVDRPLWQRKNRLHEAVRAGPEFAATDFVDDEGVAFFEAVVQRKLEGVVAKQKASPYTPGRVSKSWLEVRSLQSADFVIGGFTFGGTRRRGEPFGQLLLGGYDAGRLDYVGSVSGGLNDMEAKQIVAMLEAHATETPAFHDPPSIQRLTYWTEPLLVCRVRFSEWTRDGYLRFPIFVALRPDMAPQDCQLD